MEIGSILEINPEDLFIKNNRAIKFPFMIDDNWNLDFFNTGRAAIEAFYKSFENIKRVWVPSFICMSVVEAFIRANKEVIYYPVDKMLQPKIDYLEKCNVQNSDSFYLMQYFGVSLSVELVKYIESLKTRGVIIFEDITMSLLSIAEGKFAIGDYVLGSIRKWIAIPDGAFLASKHVIPKFEKSNAAYDYTLNYMTAQIMKSEYLKFPSKYDKEIFLSYINQAVESLFSDFSVREMSKISYNLLHTDLEEIRIKRKNNYLILNELLSQIPRIKILSKCDEGMIPFGMFILADDRDELLKYLISNDIYCNVHWRCNEAAALFEDSNYLSDHCISIPCDQRYGKKEMEYIFNTLKKWRD